jgi:hypothetical protein
MLWTYSFDAALENCIFYISPMYEFSHGLREAVFLFVFQEISSRRKAYHRREHKSLPMFLTLLQYTT